MSTESIDSMESSPVRIRCASEDPARGEWRPWELAGEKGEASTLVGQHDLVAVDAEAEAAPSEQAGADALGETLCLDQRGAPQPAEKLLERGEVGDGQRQELAALRARAVGHERVDRGSAVQVGRAELPA